MPICPAIQGATFLGCSVIDFSASAGWNAQSSEVTINLAEDCNASPPQVFLTPVVGSLLTFAMGSFSFRGLVQAWTARVGSDGNPIYNVKLISPHPILENTQLILDHYEGEVGEAYNIINVYGFLESLGANCSGANIGGTFFGAPAGGFGTANKTDRGIPWYLIQQAIQALTGGVRTHKNWCQGVAFKNQKYIIDLSSIPIANNNYRITGPVISLADLINQVCTDAGCDYYVRMVDGDANIIKIVTIPRNNLDNSLGAISTFVDQSNVIAKSVGRELRSEVNSSMVIGGKIKNYYQCTNSAGMTPFWGWNAEGGVIRSAHVGETFGWLVELDFRKINLALTTPMPNFATIGENEFRASFGDWDTFLANVTNSTNAESPLYIYYVEELGLISPKVHGDVKSDFSTTADGRAGSDGDDDETGDPLSYNLRDGKTLYNWLQSYSSDFYGKQFLVYFSLDSVVCRAIDNDTKQVTYSDQPSSDGGWPTINGVEATSANKLNVLGLANPSLAADRFKDDTGKFQPIVKFFGSGLNTQALNLSDYVRVTEEDADEDDETDITKDSYVWVKGTIEDKWVEGSPIDEKVLDIIYGETTRNNPSVNTIRSALIKIPSPVLAYPESGVVESNSPLEQFRQTGIPVWDKVIRGGGEFKYSHLLGGQTETVGGFGAPAATFPVGIGVPIQSHTQCYGPWQAIGANPGSVQVEVDEGLVPWEYGGYSYMDAAGAAKVNESITWQQEADRGEVTVPGLPQFNLASNLIPPIKVVTTLHVDSIGEYKISYYKNNASVAAGAVISDISVSVGAGGITTTYTVSSFTPVFGRFSKGNAERLKQIGLNRQKGEREMRARAALRNLITTSENRSNLAQMTSADINRGAGAPLSPAVWFAGKVNSKDTRRKTVIAPDKKALAHYKDYANTAIMTMDGLLRPVGTDGTANLPNVVTETGSCIDPSIPLGPGVVSPTCYSLNTFLPPAAPPPPISGYSPLPVTFQYLDFLADKQYNRGLFTDSRTSGSHDTLGHDIEGVARGTTATGLWDGSAHGKLLIHSGTGDLHTTDFYGGYRFLALRGPLMLHSWGYDTYGKPVPNSGTNTDKFYPNWLEDSTRWPVAPVDLRFDSRRGVWTVPPAFRLYQINVIDDIAAGAYGYAHITGASTQELWDAEGSGISNASVNVLNWTNTTMAAETRALSYYDTSTCEHWIVAGGGGGEGCGGVDADVEIVTGICCSGNQFAVKSTLLQFRSGCLHSMGYPANRNAGNPCGV